MSKLEVTLGPQARQSVHLNGVDIGPAVNAITIKGSSNRFPEVELELCVLTVEMISEETKIVLAPGVKDALLQLGWTPPESDPQ